MKSIPVNKEHYAASMVLFPHFTLLRPDGAFGVADMRGYFASWREYLHKTTEVMG